MRVRHALGIDVDLHTQHHEVDLPEYTDIREGKVEERRVAAAPPGSRCPNAGFHSLRLQNDLLNFALDGNGHIKIAGFKETENRAEVKACEICSVP